MPGPLPRAPREFHRWLVRSAIGVFSLLALYEGLVLSGAKRDPTSLAIAALSATLAVGLAFYLRWFTRRTAPPNN